MFHHIFKGVMGSSTIICFTLVFILSSLFLLISPLHGSTIGKSGQTQSFSTGDDGDLQKGVSWPIPRFTDNSNGTITDNLTGLIWVKNADCLSTLNFQQSLDAAGNLASGDCQLSDGSSAGDWHVPNIRELESLIHLGRFVPAIPNTQGDGAPAQDDPFSNFQSDSYWSSTTSPQESTSGFAVNFQYGHRVAGAKTTSRHVLFVRNETSTTPPAPIFRTGQTLCYGVDGGIIDCFGSGQDGESQAGKVWPEPRFTDPGDGTIIDTLTGLIWLKDASCLSLTNWNGAINGSNTISTGSCLLNDGSIAGDWRLPNRKELESLMDYEYFFPALSDTSGSQQWSQGNPFLNIQRGSGYWTSTTYAGFINSAWYVDFNQGVTGSNLKTDIAYVLPVRDAFMDTLSVVFNGNGTGRVTSIPEGIDCPGVCEFSFPRGDEVVLTALPEAGTSFTGWSEQSCGQNLNCTVSLTADTIIEAGFEKSLSGLPQFQLLLLD